jgi:hypothetical protein
MERTRREEPATNGQALPAHEPFSILDGATGKRRCVRDMTDEEIARHIYRASQELEQHQQSMARSTTNTLSLSAMLAVLQFEEHRRKMGITLVDTIKI